MKCEMLEADASISGIIMCCDNSTFGVNIGRIYKITAIQR